MLQDYPKVQYVKFNIGEPKVQEFGVARLGGYLLDMWQEGKLILPGVILEKNPPELTEAEMANIPGADVAMGRLDRLTFTASTRAMDKINIKDDSRREWTSVDDQHYASFKELSNRHEDQYRDALVEILKGPAEAVLAERKDDAPLAICDGSTGCTGEMYPFAPVEGCSFVGLAWRSFLLVCISGWLPHLQFFQCGLGLHIWPQFLPTTCTSVRRRG